MQKPIKSCLLVVGMIIGLTLTFWLLLALAYCIPTTLIQNHIAESAQVLQQEKENPHSFIDGTFNDNFTTALMLNEALQSSGSPFIESLLVPRGNIEQSQVENLIDTLNYEGIDYSKINYVRYWHGYLIYLKPMLLFFDIYEIRALFQTLTILALVVASILLFKKLGNIGIALALSLTFGLGCLSCFNAVAIIELFPSIFISLIGICAVLIVKSLRPFCLFIIFFMLGAFEVYFDFFTNPIFSLGIPAVALLIRVLLNKFESGSSFKLFISEKNNLVPFLYLLVAIVGWALGYCSLWFAKWILASVVLNQDVLADALSNAALRTGAIENEQFQLSPRIAVERNWAIVPRPIRYFIYFCFIVIVVISAFILFNHKGEIKQVSENIKKQFPAVSLCLIVCALLPYVWYFGIWNHSALHYPFSYRNQSLTIFALLACISVLLYRARFMLKKRNKKSNTTD